MTMYEATLKPVSNRADWIETVELVNDDTGEVITNLNDVVVVVAVRTCDPPTTYLTGSSQDGHIEFVPGGIIQWRFTAAEMRSLAARTYEIGVTVTRDGITEQELIGVLPVLDGVVR